MKIKLIIFFCFCSILFSKQTFNFPLDLEGIEYDLSIPNPEEVLGHKIGTRHTRPSQVVDYFETVASISERVVLKYHGKKVVITSINCIERAINGTQGTTIRNDI